MTVSIKDCVLMLLGMSAQEAQDNGKEPIIDFLISDTVEAVKAYCRLEDIPAQLEMLVALMTSRRYRENEFGNSEQLIDVKSISEGDRNISFERRDMSGILEDYSERLKPFINRKGRLPSEI